MEFDKEQNAFLNRTDDELLLCAGPGSGKTTTLCELAKRNSDKRVLFLVYTTAAQNAITMRIKSIGSKCVDRGSIDKNYEGIYVLSFSQYAFQRTKINCKKEYTNDSKWDASLRLAEKTPIKTWEQYDIIIIDEVQDIQATHEPFIEQLKYTCGRIIYAGDIRQSLFESSFMENLDCPKHHLLTNYRSEEDIVHTLNMFSQHFWPDEPIQKWVKNGGKVEMEEFDFPRDIAFGKIGRYINANQNRNSFIIAPISIDKWKMEDIISTVRENCNDKVVVARSGSATRFGYGPVAGSSTMLKGLETDRVFFIGGCCSYFYLKSLASAFYVAMSRAKKELHICFCKPSLNHMLIPLGLGGHKLEDNIITYLKTENVSDLKIDINKQMRSVSKCKLRGAPNDFINTFAVVMSAKKSGCLMPNRYEVIVEKGIPKSISIKDEQIYIEHRGSKRYNLREDFSPLGIAKTLWTFKADQEWTLGDSLVGKIKDIGLQCDTWNRLISYPICFCNTKLQSGLLYMNSGLENKDNIYDIVYADEITESRFIMCVIKGYCLGKKANIVNLKKGLVFELDFDIPNLQLLLRAKLVFKQVKGLNLKGIKRCPTIMYSCVEDWTVIFDRTHILDIIIPVELSLLKND
jgi:hypothetical protein